MDIYVDSIRSWLEGAGVTVSEVEELGTDLTTRYYRFGLRDDYLTQLSYQRLEGYHYLVARFKIDQELCFYAKDLDSGLMWLEYQFTMVAKPGFPEPPAGAVKGLLNAAMESHIIPRAKDLGDYRTEIHEIAENGVKFELVRGKERIGRYDFLYLDPIEARRALGLLFGLRNLRNLRTSKGVVI